MAAKNHLILPGNMPPEVFQTVLEKITDLETIYRLLAVNQEVSKWTNEFCVGAVKCIEIGFDPEENALIVNGETISFDQLRIAEDEPSSTKKKKSILQKLRGFSPFSKNRRSDTSQTVNELNRVLNYFNSTVSRMTVSKFTNISEISMANIHDFASQYGLVILLRAILQNLRALRVAKNFEFTFDKKCAG